MYKLYVKLLKGALQKLKRGETYFVCHAIQEVADESTNEKEQTAAKELVTFIMVRLDGCNTVSSWLRKQGICLADLTPTTMAEYRIRWVESMIEKYSDKPVRAK